MVEFQPSKLAMRVRFPLPAPIVRVTRNSYSFIFLNKKAALKGCFEIAKLLECYCTMNEDIQDSQKAYHHEQVHLLLNC